MNKPTEDISEFGLIIRDCAAILPYFSNSSMSFVRRPSNSVAHSLVKATLFSASPLDYHVAPSYIAALIINDMH